MGNHTKLAEFGMTEFLERRFHVDAGEHISIIAPTGGGKTSLGMTITNIARKQTPYTRAVVIALKPDLMGRKATYRPVPAQLAPYVLMKEGWLGDQRRTGDDTVAAYANFHGAKVVRTWPPPKRFFWEKKAPYYVMWPRHVGDLGTNSDYKAHRELVYKTLQSAHKQGDTWIFADEVEEITKDLALERELRTMWRKSRSVHTGIIAATQRPSDVPLLMYSSATHLFLGNTPDQRDQKRYAEIGGFDPKLIQSVVADLPRFSMLYLNRAGRTQCIVHSDGHMPDLPAVE